MKVFLQGTPVVLRFLLLLKKNAMAIDNNLGQKGFMSFYSSYFREVKQNRNLEAGTDTRKSPAY